MGLVRLFSEKSWVIMLLGAVLLPAAASADPRQNEGAEGARVRFHADTDLLGYTFVNPTQEILPGEDAPESHIIGVGLGRSTLGDSGALFLLHPRPGWGIGVGGVFADSRAVVGAKFHFAVDNIRDDEPVRTTFLSGQIVPYFRWLFRRKEWIRPYAEVRFGMGGGGVISNDTDAEEKTTDATIYPTVGGGLGLAIFPVDYFSVDLGLNCDYYSVHARSKGPAVDDESFERFGDIVNAAVSLGVSVWFG